MANVDQVWAEIEAGLATDPAVACNTAWEACGRYADQPGKPALVVYDEARTPQHWTYRDLDQAAARTANLFTGRGLRPGDRVAAVLSRQVESLIVALAAWRAGLVYVPLFCGFGADALAMRIQASGAALVVADHRYRDGLAAGLALVDREVTVCTVTESGGRDPDFWAELDRSAPRAPWVRTRASDPATLMFTSGTTGKPKPCVMPHSGLLSLLPFAKYALGVDDRSLLFTTADPGWSYGLYTTGVVPMALGVPRVIYRGPFDPDAWWDVMQHAGVTVVAGAPSAYRRLTAALRDRGAPDRLVAANAAGEPLDADTAANWVAAGGPPIRDGYGLSEVGMLLGDLAVPPTEGVHGSEPVPPTEPVPGTMASAIPGFDVLLVDEAGRPVPDGEPGLIAVRHPRYQLTVDYEGRQEEWARRWIGDLFVTQDRACRDADGRWRFIGRHDDIIVTSGYNVGPVEVEAVLLETPGVAEAAAVAAPGRRGGTVVRAVLVRAPGAPPETEIADAVREAVTARIGRHASPRVVDFVDALPRNEVGKLQRGKLRAGDARAW